MVLSLVLQWLIILGISAIWVAGFKLVLVRIETSERRQLEEHKNQDCEACMDQILGAFNMLEEAT